MPPKKNQILAASMYVATYLDNHYRMGVHVLDAYRGHEEELLQTAIDLEFVHATRGGCVAVFVVTTPLSLRNIYNAVQDNNLETVDFAVFGCALLTGWVFNEAAKALTSIQNHVNDFMGTWETRPTP